MQCSDLPSRTGGTFSKLLLVNSKPVSAQEWEGSALRSWVSDVRPTQGNGGGTLCAPAAEPCVARTLIFHSGRLVKVSLDFRTPFQSGGLENDGASVSFPKFYEQGKAV